MSKKIESSISYNNNFFESGLTKALRKYIDGKLKELNLKQDNGDVIKKDISLKTGIKLDKLKKIYSGTATLYLHKEGHQIYNLTQLLGCNIWALMGVTEDGDDVELNTIGLTNASKLKCQRHNLNLFRDNIHLDPFLQLLNYTICEENFLNNISTEACSIINDIRTNIPDYSNYSYNDLYNMLPQELKDRIDTLLKHTESQSKKVISNFLKDKLSE